MHPLSIRNVLSWKLIYVSLKSTSPLSTPTIHSVVQQVRKRLRAHSIPNLLYDIQGELPLLKDGTTWVAGVDRILAHLGKRGLDGNRELSPEQKAEYLAYSAMAQEKLMDCMVRMLIDSVISMNVLIDPCISITYSSLRGTPT